MRLGLVKEIVKVESYERAVEKRPENVRNKKKVIDYEDGRKGKTKRKSATVNSSKSKGPKRDSRGRFAKR
ncbi:MAG: hypothetical protein Q4P17_07660 [Methanobacterium sp.]|nr:hypothetical protein [Methanobacterium sp.]